MKMKSLRVLGAGVAVALVLSSCDGLGKMLKKQKDIQYTVTPNPVEMIGDSVQFSVNGKFNPKLFAKKVTLVITPVLKYASGGEKAFNPVTLVGEKATGSGQKISYSGGGTFSYTSDKLTFEDGMRNAKLELRAVGQVKSKTKNFDPVEIADGVLATSLLVRNDEKPTLGADNFQKSYPANQTTHIYYVINQSNVRPGEMKSDEMKAFTEFMKANIGSQWYNFKGISVSAYASPDGETDRNENLAKDRAKSGSTAILGLMKSANKVKDNNFGKSADQYQVGTTKEDWEGFKQLMEQSTMADKELILRVLTMYSDPNQRRQEIKNMSKTYTELAEKILPKLRRSEITVMVDKISRTDEMITKLAETTPDSLSLEELLYAGAKLVTDVNTKIAIYKNAEARFGADWRTSNNLGAAYLMQNDLNSAAEAFKRADKVANGAPEVANNMGILESKKGNRALAYEMYDKAKSLKEAKYNMGIIDIRNGKYADAVANMGDYKGHNKALAEFLNNNTGSVKPTIEGSDEKDQAYSFYLLAVNEARQGNTSGALENLKTAIEKDAAWKEYAKNDCEFLKMRSDSGFTSLVN